MFDLFTAEEWEAGGINGNFSKGRQLVGVKEES